MCITSHKSDKIIFIPTPVSESESDSVSEICISEKKKAPFLTQNNKSAVLCGSYTNMISQKPTFKPALTRGHAGVRMWTSKLLSSL